MTGVETHPAISCLRGYSSRFCMIGYICPNAIDGRTNISDIFPMRRDAFLRALRSYAKAHDLAWSWDPDRGKGGHGTVTVGEAFTTVPSGEIKVGLKFAILKQLGLPKNAV
jgi:hypothetical protein